MSAMMLSSSEDGSGLFHCLARAFGGVSGRGPGPTTAIRVVDLRFQPSILSILPHHTTHHGDDNE